MVVTEIVAPVEVAAGARVSVRAHTGHAVPAQIGAEADLLLRMDDMYHAAPHVLHLVRPTVLAVEAYLRMGWTSSPRMCHNVSSMSTAF